MLITVDRIELAQPSPWVTVPVRYSAMLPSIFLVYTLHLAARIVCEEVRRPLNQWKPETEGARKLSVSEASER
jgi:hypothetical protein